MQYFREGVLGPTGWLLSQSVHGIRVRRPISVQRGLPSPGHRSVEVTRILRPSAQQDKTGCGGLRGVHGGWGCWQGGWLLVALSL